MATTATTSAPTTAARPFPLMYYAIAFAFTAAEAAAQTMHINIMMTIVLWVAAVVVVLVYGPRNLSRHPRQALVASASGESQPRVR